MPHRELALALQLLAWRWPRASEACKMLQRSRKARGKSFSGGVPRLSRVLEPRMQSALDVNLESVGLLRSV